MVGSPGVGAFYFSASYRRTAVVFAIPAYSSHRSDWWLPFAFGRTQGIGLGATEEEHTAPGRACHDLARYLGLGSISLPKARDGTIG